MRYRLKTHTVTLAVNDPCASRSNPCRSSEDAARLARPIYETLDAGKEHFLVFCLNNKSRFQAFKVISSGSLTASMVHPREVFLSVILEGAAAMVLIHNHPSGEPSPSPEDIEITRRLKQCAEIFGIRLLDHVIVGDGSERFYSFSDHGIL
jgi:DNA repair protein RadC